MSDADSHSEGLLDLSAFNRLFGAYRERFIRFATGYTGDRTVAEDIVMESFFASWERRDTLTEATFPPYALTVVRNRCLNHLRAQEVRLRAAENLHSRGMRLLRVRVASLQACDPEELFGAEARRLVEEALDRLPPRTRDVFVRSRVAGESYKQIAAETGTTVKSVEFEISKAMKLLRVVLKDYLPLLAFWLYVD